MIEMCLAGALPLESEHITSVNHPVSIGTGPVPFLNICLLVAPTLIYHRTIELRTSESSQEVLKGFCLEIGLSLCSICRVPFLKISPYISYFGRRWGII